MNKTSGYKKGKIFSIIIFFLCAIVFYMAYNFRDTSDNFDLPRYYSLMDFFFNGSESIRYVIAYMYAFGNDFIYYVFLFLFNNTPLGREFVPGMFTAAYYFLLMKSFRNNVIFSSERLLLLLGLFAFPNIMYVITISRTTAAIVFFFIGVLLYSNDKKIASILLFAMAVMSHYSSLMFVLVFFLSLLLYRFVLKDKKRTVNAICVVLPPLMFFLGLALFNSVSERVFSFVEDTKYDRYATSSQGTDFSNFSWLYMLQFYLTLLVTYILLIINKQSTSFSRVLLMVCLSITCGLMSANQNLFNRWLMLLPLLYSLQFDEIFVTNRELVTSKLRKEINSIGVIESTMVLLVFILMMYSSHSYFGL